MNSLNHIGNEQGIERGDPVRQESADDAMPAKWQLLEFLLPVGADVKEQKPEDICRGLRVVSS